MALINYAEPIPSSAKVSTIAPFPDWKADTAWPASTELQQEIVSSPDSPSCSW